MRFQNVSMQFKVSHGLRKKEKRFFGKLLTAPPEVTSLVLSNVHGEHLRPSAIVVVSSSSHVSCVEEGLYVQVKANFRFRDYGTCDRC